jgi:hypothetical protein
LDACRDLLSKSYIDLISEPILKKIRAVQRAIEVPR